MNQTMTMQIPNQTTTENSTNNPLALPVDIKFTYPYSNEYEYKTWLERIDLDKQRVEDIKSGKGFIIKSTRSIKNDVKNRQGIFSARYGSTITDVDSFNGKYRCLCGLTRGSIMHGERCPFCNHIVKFYDDDVTITGWFVLKNRYVVIHPNIYQTIAAFIGPTRLARIIEPEVQVNSDGQIVQIGNPNAKKDEPFRGIGMLSFRDRYEEILNFYLAKFPQKKLFYDDLMANRGITFTHSIAVYSALLRPFQLEAGSLKYESTNENFMLLSSLVYRCNQDSLKMDQKPKEKLNILNDMQVQINAVYDEIIAMLSKKKGDIRSAIGGRYAFSSRSVIRQDPYLHANEIRLPFHGLMELLQQVIINILTKTMNMSYASAYKRWYKAQISGNDRLIYNIIDGLIKDSGGIPVLINRNPTIVYGGILRCKCVGINMDYTMSISLLTLKLLKADFDGDTLNILLLLNKAFADMTDKIFNPNQMYISRNDGLCNGDMLPARDTLVNGNGLKSLGRYNQQEIEMILRCQNTA